MDNNFDTIWEIKVEIQPIDEHPTDKNDQNIDNQSNIFNQFTKNGTGTDNEIQGTKINTRKFNCDMCPKAFPTESKLNRHVSGVHFKLKNHPCHLCEKKFSEIHHLKQHIAMVHHGIKNFNCDVCDTRFARSQDLKNHRINVHGKIKPAKMAGKLNIGITICKLCNDELWYG